MPAAAAVAPGIAFTEAPHGIAFGSNIAARLQIGVRGRIVVLG